ncbi:MAG: radical SAM protein [Chloroflexota bacterium]
MDILYVHPAKQEVDARFDKFKSSSSYPFIPVGIVGLVNMLRGQGWDVEGINLPMELVLHPTFDLRAWVASRPRAKLVMIDCHWYEHSYGSMEAARACKDIWPDTPIVVGGLTASNFAEEILTDHPYVDYIVRGDGEEPLTGLAAYCCSSGGSTDLAQIPNLVYRQGKRIAQNQRAYFADPAMLDSLDFVTVDWLKNWRSYAAIQYSGSGTLAIRDHKYQGHWLTVGRGCVFNCIYCGGGKKSHKDLAGRSGYVVRDPANVVEDIARLKKLGYHQVSLSLDPATFKPEWWRTFFRLLREQEITIGLYNEFFQSPSKDFLDEFAKSVDLAHTEVAISPLSGNEAVRKQNGKHYTNQKFLQMLRTLKNYEIPIFIYFSLNLPGETPQTFRETLYLAKDIGELYPPHLLRMLNPCHTLDPASPMSRQPGAYKLDVHYTTFKDYYTYCRGTGWQPRQVIRGQHRGFEMHGRSSKTVEQMAQVWDMFAKQQKFQCFPVPMGW